MTKKAIWSLEEAFWTGGEDHYAGTLDPDCIMAFPAPAGILARTHILESLKEAPRWSSVSMSERQSSCHGSDLVVIAYRAEGRRENSAPYRAYCTSTYRRTAQAWRLIQHQQTPIAG